MKSKFLFPLFLLALIGCVSLETQAQDTVLRRPDRGILDSLQSGILKEKRLIEVFVPTKFKTRSTDKYDVLYVLDGGNWNTGMINQLQEFLEGERSVPPMIVVSILGIDRNKDLTPTPLKDWKTAGGGANFLNFIKNELIPYVDKKYPSNGDNALWGHSLGGLFVINALLTEPNTFKSYIAVDPSLWWGDGYTQKLAREKLPALKGVRTTLFISGRAGKDGEGMKIAAMDSILRKLAPVELSWKYVIYPTETHSSIRLKTTYDGLKFSYGWNGNRIEFHPMAGIIAKGKPIKVWNFGDTSQTVYTTDETEPGLTSAKLQPETILSKPTTFMVKGLTNRAHYDLIAKGVFSSGEALAPVTKPKKALPGGLRYSYYEGEFNNAAQLKNLKPQQTGLVAADFSVDKLPKGKKYAFILDGMLEAKQDGYYIFILKSNKGTRLYLKNQLLIQCEGSPEPKTGSYILPLKKGFYPIRLENMNRDEQLEIQMSYLTPDKLDTKDPNPIPFELLYSIR